MIRAKNLFKTGVAAITALAAPAAAFATNTINLSPPAGTAFDSTKDWTITRLAGATINLILVGAGLVAFFFFLYGGLQWILAGGDKEATEKARKRITSSLIGLVIIFSTYAFVALVGQFLGVQLLSFNIVNV